MKDWFEKLNEAKKTEIWNLIENNITDNIAHNVWAQIEDLDEEDAVELFDIEECDFDKEVKE